MRERHIDLVAYRRADSGKQLIEKGSIVKHFVSFIGLVFVLSFGVTLTVDGTERGVPRLRTLAQPPPAQSAESGGAALLESSCTSCHVIGGWEHLAEYSEQDWRDLIYQMIDYGAPLTEAETDTISLYLTATAGLTIEPADTLVAESAVPEAGGLLDTLCTVCHEVGGWEHLAEYSEQDWRDLIDRMVNYGAPVTEAETDTISLYLTATAGLTIEPADTLVAESAVPEAEGLLDTLCTVCHEVGGWEHLAEYSEQDWRDLIDRMVNYGAPVTEAETDTISLYLTATAGLTIEPADTLVAESAVPEAEGLLDTLCTVCHEVGGWEHLAEYSEQDWRDLIDRMVNYGAPVTEAETDTISLYLTATAGLTIEPADTLVAENAVPEAEGLLDTLCTVCHEVGGWEHLAEYSEQDWRDLIDRMVNYGAPLTEDEVDILVGHLRATEGLTIEPADTGVVAEGATLLQSACTACHEVTGFEDLGFTAEVWLETIDRMLNYGEVLIVSDDEINTLVAYLTGDADAEAAPAPDGAALLQSACTACHEVTGFEDLGFTAEVWLETIDRMLNYGASLSDADTETLIRYLTGGAADEAEDTAVRQ